MLYRQAQPRSLLSRVLLALLVLVDRQRGRRRRVELDLLALSPYLQRDIGFPPDGETSCSASLGGGLRMESAGALFWRARAIGSRTGDSDWPERGRDAR